MSRSWSNSRVTRVWPRVDDELITATSEIVANCFSSCVATEEAMFLALAPGSTAVTWIVGVSNCGSAAMGMSPYAKTPATTVAADSRTVITGRRMKTSEKFISGLLLRLRVGLGRIPFRGLWLRFGHGASGAQVLRALDDDAGAGLQPVDHRGA